MGIKFYLAMTGQEMEDFDAVPENAGWMFCPFSGEEEEIPFYWAREKLLVITDAVPAENTDGKAVLEKLSAMAPERILMDFQRMNDNGHAFAKSLRQAMGGAVILPAASAEKMDGPVFLPPVPLHSPLSAHIAPWKGREIWLDLSAEGERITLTETGSVFEPLLCFFPTEKGHREERLHCHYSISLNEQNAVFTLWRTEEDNKDLLREAEALGVHNVIGLYQEWRGYDMSAFREA